MSSEENCPEVTRRYRELATKVSQKYRWDDVVEVLHSLGKRDWNRVETATAALPESIQKVARDAVSGQIGSDENMLKVMEEAATILEMKQATAERPPNVGGEVKMRWRN